MSYKVDIQATYLNAYTSTAVIQQPIRLRGIIIASNNSTTVGQVDLNTTSSSGGTTLFQASIAPWTNVTLPMPGDGIPFPKGIYVSTITNVASVTLLTDRYSGPYYTTSNGPQ